MPAPSHLPAQLLESDDIKGRVVEDGFTILSHRDWFFATTFAPIFYQETTLNPRTPGDAGGAPDRVDFITRIDFDGNWIAADNWQNFESPRADFRAVVYFSTAETETHFFICYTVFHPRDTGSVHENDLEGALVVVEKEGGDAASGRLVYVQTLAHNVFYKYINEETVRLDGLLPRPDRVLVEGRRPLIYIEPRGHGIRRLDDKKPTALLPNRAFIVYRYKGREESPEQTGIQDVGYDLVPLYGTLWKAALLDSETNPTFTDFRDYGEFQVTAAAGAVARDKHAGREMTLSRAYQRVGASMVGNDGRANAAHPPWGWSLDGRWFFLPAEQIQKDFRPPAEFSLKYLHHPFLQIYRQ